MTNFHYHGSRTHTQPPTPHPSGESFSWLPNGRPIHMCAPTYHGEKFEAPWQQMAQAYTWVVEQEIIKYDKRDRKTEQWILEQQIYLTAERDDERLGSGSYNRQKNWEELVYTYEAEAEQWMRRQDEARRVASERLRRARVMQEELKRIEAKIRSKREAERRRFTEEKARAYQEIKERQRIKQLKADKAMLAAWRRYEERWSDLAAMSEPLDFSSIPWPLLAQPTKAEDLDPSAIVSFLLSSVHSAGQSNRDRVRSGQLRWHPDRFRRILAKVKEEEKAEVEVAVGIVARCLNDI